MEGVSGVKLDLNELIASPGSKKEFSFVLPVDDLTFDGVLAYLTPVTVEGAVENHAGLLELHAVISAELLCQCARCLKEFPMPYRCEAAAYLADELEDEDSEDYYLLTDGVADLEEIARDALIFNFEPRVLCKEDCKGLCEKCGKDLNDGPCDCKEDLDPRWLALGQLLENEN